MSIPIRFRFVIFYDAFIIFYVELIKRSLFKKKSIFHVWLHWQNSFFEMLHLANGRDICLCLKRLSVVACRWHQHSTTDPTTTWSHNHVRGATSAVRAPKPGKTPIMATRCRLLFFKIEVRPRSCPQFYIQLVFKAPLFITLRPKNREW